MRSLFTSIFSIWLLFVDVSVWAGVSGSGVNVYPGGESLDSVVQEEQLNTVECKGSDLNLYLLSKGVSIDQYRPSSGTFKDLAVTCKGTKITFRCPAGSGGIQNLVLQARHSGANYTLIVKKGVFPCTPRSSDCLTDELVGFMLSLGKPMSNATKSEETLPFSAAEDQDGARTIWFLAKVSKLNHEYVPAKDIPNVAWVKPISMTERKLGDLVWWKEYVGLFDGANIIRLGRQEPLSVQDLEIKYGPAKYFRILK